MPLNGIFQEYERLNPTGSIFLICLQVHVWDTSNGQLKQKLPVSGAPVDICPFKVNENDFLAALTEKYVSVFKWS